MVTWASVTYHFNILSRSSLSFFVFLHFSSEAQCELKELHSFLLSGHEAALGLNIEFKHFSPWAWLNISMLICSFLFFFCLHLLEFKIMFFLVCTVTKLFSLSLSPLHSSPSPIQNMLVIFFHFSSSHESLSWNIDCFCLHRCCLVCVQHFLFLFLFSSIHRLFSLIFLDVCKHCGTESLHRRAVIVYSISDVG